MNQLPAAPECWLITLDQPEYSIRQLSGLLSPNEKQRAAAFSTPALRAQWTVARAGLRLLLARTLGLPPQDLIFRLGEFGKPELADASESIHFNLAHTDSHAACVLSRSSPVGIDLEHRDRGEELLSCREAFCHSEERHLAPSAANLIRLWCAKEAALKAAGFGFHIEPNQVQVTGWDLPPIQAILPEAADSPWQIVFPELPDSEPLCLAVALPPDSIAPVLKHWDWEQF